MKQEEVGNLVQVTTASKLSHLRLGLDAKDSRNYLFSHIGY